MLKSKLLFISYKKYRQQLHVIVFIKQIFEQNAYTNMHYKRPSLMKLHQKKVGEYNGQEGGVNGNHTLLDITISVCWNKEFVQSTI